ncbi:hypothetical protein [Umezawaea sp.]|uniref:hypothetical protein n=1 Tax=Umezawaea sp. TaxID=1955258 RepID=UPI002ED55FC4
MPSDLTEEALVARQDGMVLGEVEACLKRLVGEHEFVTEIGRLKLKPSHVVAAVSKERPVMAGARRAFESVAGLEEDIDVHRNSKPRWWPPVWKPTPAEWRCMIAMVGVPACWFALLLSFGAHLPAPVVVLSLLIVLPGSIGCALFGLPVEFWHRLLWAAVLVRLAVRVPTHRWDQRQELRDEVLRPALRKWLGAQTTPSFDLVLELRDADGLSLPAGEGPLVRTSAVDECAREVNRRLPGAVGLAGARGAGKSTIIKRAVGNEFTDSDSAPMLGVLTSAPVRYDARDFVLHLHACVCRAVLDFLAHPGDRTGSETRHEWARLHRRYLFRRRAADVSKAVHWAAAWLLMALGFAGLAWGWDGGVPALVREAAEFTDQLWANAQGVVENRDLRGGAAVLALFFALRGAWGLAWVVLRPLLNALPRLVARQRSPTGRGPARAALEVVARQHLRTIRFLQTHTSGWSGKVSAPIGSELGWTRSLAKAEQPWTHPEVVGRLRDFLDLVVDVLAVGMGELSGIVVAIDELDKIADPEEAQRFLNEIKGVFGVRHCLFLVSVSDDALTAFERRGIPARDAFDSAFTTMVHVRPFTLAESRDWLAQRALGIPEPFVWLCHCMSAGSPRDLGRTAIALHDLHERHTGELLLADVTRALVRQDLDLKLRAFTHSARRTARSDTDPPDQPQSLIRALRDATTADVARLLPLAEDVWRSSRSTPPTPLAELCAEVACYLLFCQVLTEVFGGDFGRVALARVARELGAGESGGVAVALAAARQHMAIDTALAWSVLGEFRVALGAALSDRSAS